MPQDEFKKLVDKQKEELENEHKEEEMKIIRDFIRNHQQNFNREVLKNYRSMTHEELVTCFYQGKTYTEQAKQPS